MPDEVHSMQEKYGMLKDNNYWAEKIILIFRMGSQQRTYLDI